MHVAICGRAPPPSVARMISDQYVALANNEILSKRYSHRLLATIDQALSVRPEHRPQSMAAMREALGLPAISTVATIPATTPVQAPGPKVAPSPAPTPSRRALFLGAGLAIMLLVAGVGCRARPHRAR